jgi:hypothetical protein
LDCYDRMRLWIVPLLTALLPVAAWGSCAAGSPPSYDDVTYVSVKQFALAGQLHPWYSYEGTLYRGSAGPQRARVSLVAHHGLPRDIRGNELVAVDPPATFAAIVQALKANRFFDLRLTPARTPYLDGPEDAVTVSRCAVSTTLGTIPYGTEFDLADGQARSFFALEADVRAAIGAAAWTEPTPEP